MFPVTFLSNSNTKPPFGMASTGRSLFYIRTNINIITSQICIFGVVSNREFFSGVDGTPISKFLPAPQLTAKAPENRPKPNRTFHRLQPSIFQVQTCCSGRIIQKKNLPTFRKLLSKTTCTMSLPLRSISSSRTCDRKPPEVSPIIG